jgi:ABC-type branched-subunit amino acid transport system ATPase component
MSAMLALDRIERRFGAVRALDGVSLTVAPGAIHGLIGPNGSGKTTLFNVASGLLRPTAGRVQFDGQDFSRISLEASARRGLVRTFQHTTHFGRVTVRENLDIALSLRSRPRRSDRTHEIAELLALCRLEPVAGEEALRIPYGYARRLGIALALAVGPKMLLLDEPAAGLNGPETEELGEIIAAVNDVGLTVLLIEHDMSLVMSMCHLVSVLSSGRKIAEGTPDQIVRDPLVTEVYLGTGS